MLLMSALASLNFLEQNISWWIQQQDFTLPSKIWIALKMEAFMSQELEEMVKTEYELQLYGFSIKSFTDESRLIELLNFMF